MSEPYLWDKSGTPDPEIVKLERLLGNFSHRPQESALPAVLQREIARYETPFQLTQLAQDPLPTRLAVMVRANWQAFWSNPRAYVQALTEQTGPEQLRSAALRWCFFSTFAVHIVAYGVLFLMPAKAVPEGGQAASEKQDLQLIGMVEPPPQVQGKGTGTNGKQAGGGGGGGNHEPTPASKGRLPQASLMAPHIVAPSTHQHIEQPSLPVVPTIQADPNLVAKQDMNLPLGDPKGVLGEPSDGFGSGGGIGTGRGGGIGSGVGSGAGPGHGDGIGEAGGAGSGNANLRPSILSQVKPKYSEEARQNKVQGKVVLSVEFRADGTIGEVRIVRGLGYGLDERAIEAARQIRFRPAVQNGVPVTTRAKVEFTFNLI
ncbi:MAG: energy transducer TonB [Blastocatellia bacterium]|nr:energy transducer TonB [Blastocatellia bacterium]